MHTIGGKPASYDVWWGRGYIHYAHSGRGRCGARLAESLKQIRQEQAEDRRNRGVDNLPPSDYGYVPVMVPG